MEEFILIRCVSVVSGTLIFGGRVHIDKVCKCGARDTNFLVEEMVLMNCVHVAPGTPSVW